MGMVVKNNLSAKKTLNVLNANTATLQESLAKVSSGMKINGAKDDTASFAISEKMRSLIRALEQDISNSQTGMNLVRTAEGGIQGIIDSLGTMRELAINSLNDHNSEEDRKILQKEFSSRMADIDSLACETNYNGIILLDGRWRQKSAEGATETRTRIETVTEYETITEEYPETVTTYEDVEETYTETVITYTTEEETYTETVTTYTTEEETYTETVITYTTEEETYTETVMTETTVEETYTETVITNTEVTEEYPYTYTVTTETPLESNAVRPSAATPTGVELSSGGGVHIIPSEFTGDLHITSNGVWRIPEKYKGTIYIDAQNVMLTQEKADRPLVDVYIETRASGNTNLWLNNLNLMYSTRNENVDLYSDEEGNVIPVFNRSFINFQGSNNVLTLCGSNKITLASNYPPVGASRSNAIYEKAFVNVGDGLTIEAQSPYLQPAKDTLEFNEGNLSPRKIYGAFIGSDHNEASNANITINSGKITTSSDYAVPYGMTYGAVIGSGYGGSIGNIVINGGTFDMSVAGGGACIGGGENSTTGYITVQDATIKASCDDGACIGSGSATDSAESRTGYIYILNSNLDLDTTEKAHSGLENPSGTGAAIGGGGTFGGSKTYVGDITVENSTVKAVTDRGAGIGTGGDSENGGTGEPHAYGISTINSTLDLTVNDSRAEEIGKGVNGIIPVNTVEEEVTEMRTRTVIVPVETTETKTRTVTVPTETTVTKTRTVEVPHEETVTKTRTVEVPHEETVTKTRTVEIPHEETVTKTRTVTVPHEETVTKTRTFTISHEVTRTVEYEEPIEYADNPLIIHTGPKANEELRLHINDMRTKALGIAKAAVDPLEKAREALDKVDSAIDYALNENTRMGAYQSRLEATTDNLIVEQENVMNAESNIRDADMAKEMINYTKANVLSQAAQAILAQANQSAGSVLNLLQ